MKHTEVIKLSGERAQLAIRLMLSSAFQRQAVFDTDNVVEALLIMATKDSVTVTFEVDKDE
jgi:hypothetical protein